jgi:hypothetical protein
MVPTVDLAGIATFEMEYAHWVEEQQKQTFELRSALQAHVSEIELNILVELGLNHYHNLFRMKADAAKADVFYLLSGVWRTSTERFFLWIGGFRPSELLNVISNIYSQCLKNANMLVSKIKLFLYLLFLFWIDSIFTSSLLVISVLALSSTLLDDCISGKINIYLHIMEKEK